MQVIQDQLCIFLQLILKIIDLVFDLFYVYDHEKTKSFKILSIPVFQKIFFSYQKHRIR